MIKFIQYALIVIFSIGFVGMMVYGFNKAERYECLKWQKEAKEYPGYYLTHWQKGQCDARGIEIDAPVL